MMNKFYFSFGSDPQFPFYKGWVEVAADTLEKAIEKFRAKYPDRTPGIVNCAFWYSQIQWDKVYHGEAGWGSCHAEIA